MQTSHHCSTLGANADTAEEQAKPAALQKFSKTCAAADFTDTDLLQACPNKKN
jgi:hypothetical protein